MVKDIEQHTYSSSPDQLKVVGSLMFFVANDDSHGIELWRTDGTEAGTFLLQDLRPGAGDSDVFNMTAVGSTLYFTVTRSSRLKSQCMLCRCLPCQG